jgi:hypothetical protein
MNRLQPQREATLKNDPCRDDDKKMPGAIVAGQRMKTNDGFNRLPRGLQ